MKPPAANPPTMRARSWRASPDPRVLPTRPEGEALGGDAGRIPLPNPRGFLPFDTSCVSFIPDTCKGAREWGAGAGGRMGGEEGSSAAIGASMWNEGQEGGMRVLVSWKGQGRRKIVEGSSRAVFLENPEQGKSG